MQIKGWHVAKVEIRRLKEGGKGSKIYEFPCNRWFSRSDDDKAIERDLVATKILDEKIDRGELKTKERDVYDRLESKNPITNTQ
jgi:hypothetical protein